MNCLRQYHATGSREWPLRGPACLIGSASDCDIVLGEGALPPVALELSAHQGQWEIHALTPCLRNGHKLTGKAVLVPGDRLELQGEILIYDEARQPAQPSDSNGGATLSPAASREFSMAAAVQEFARRASEERDMARLLEASLAAAKHALQATEAFVLTLDAQGGLKAAAGLGKADGPERFSDSIVQAVLRQGQGLVLSEAARDERFNSARSIAELQLQSVVCAPVLLGGKVTGCVYLGSRKLHVAYGDADLQALQAFAQLLGLLVHNVDFMERQALSLNLMADAQGEGGLVAQSPGMLKVLREADAVASADIAVLIQGETGTGKELLAERLHRRSRRAKGPLVAVNCSSLRGELLESELFGYKRGAFTGAAQDRQGLFAAAQGGTLFLDEIGEMDAPLQSKLLRALETGKIRPVGATQEEAVDVRVVCATHRDLKTMAAEKAFREDLYYRLAPITLTLPPLRDRGADLPLLAHAFLEKFKARYPAKDMRGFHPHSVRAMTAYAWPGNVRELLNAVHKAILLSPGPLAEVDLGTGKDEAGEPEFLGFEDATLHFQRDYMEKALALVSGNREQAAKLLKMSRSTFFRYLAQLGVE